ncbi:MAG: hypothetical protein HOP12_08705 [Candidatus Eisenbacteria bacterium]|uniref:Soluble ligand binding domain-containing protein n=1 Tax=Eiseniibacteriota bacterium TaxID=2212470 RepID=A0A849SKL1_UNCEI|nr:hypothetical protein [Candidatus Eisenbacteria bacterium]
MTAIRSPRAFALLLSLTLLLGAAPSWAVLPDPPADTAGTDWSRAPEYRIVPGDILTLNFGPTELVYTDKTRLLRVRPDGRISVYPVGDVVAAGRSPRELEASLRDLLSAELKQPRVTVEVTELAGNLVHVLGRVKRAGSLPVTPFMTVLQAITGAGGFEDDAARNSILVMRRDGASTVRVARLKFDSAMRRGDFNADPMLSRFDIVYVPRSSIGNINIFVKQFFGEQAALLTTALTGWELFHIDRLYPNIVRVETSN